jgi:hypothetical protein
MAIVLGSAMEIYSLANYNDIVFAGYDYKLTADIISIINKLSSELGVVSEQNTSSTDKNRAFKSKTGSQLRSRTKPEETWEKVKAFKTTKIEKKDGIEKLINDIRICLNKISIKNYETHRDTIVQYIKEIVEGEDGKPDELSKVTKAIFDIASSNKFYSELYARLYKELTEIFPSFNEIVSTFVLDYVNSIQNIQYFDPKVDYDKYCDNNKENDKRKAMSAFIVNLAKNDILQNEQVIGVIVQLEKMVLKYIDEPDKTNEVEEITENIFIFVTMALETMSTAQDWQTVIDNINKCSQSKPKEHPSMSSRALFKYMDILDFIKKNEQ